MKTTSAWLVAVGIAAFPGFHTIMSEGGKIEGRLFPVTHEFRLDEQAMDEVGNVTGFLHSRKNRLCLQNKITYHVGDGGGAEKTLASVTYLDRTSQKHVSHPPGSIDHGRIKFQSFGKKYLYIYTAHDCGGLWIVQKISDPIELVANGGVPNS